MAGEFGEHLKREREMRGVSLQEIAAATRISVRFLEALENETWNTLPGGVFNRGFVRTVSRYLGLEEESLLAEYSLARGIDTPPPLSEPVPPAPKKLVSEDKSSAPKYVATAVASVLLIGGTWYAWRQFSARRLEMIAAERALPTSPLPPAAPSNIWEIAPSTVQANPVSFSAGGSVADLQLRITAKKPTSIEITSDGLQSFAGTIAAGENRNFSAKNNFIVAAQDSGAIQLQLNGQALAPMGPSGQPAKLTLSNPAPSNDSGGHD
jgi:cytoskeletal protein RodZ